MRPVDVRAPAALAGLQVRVPERLLARLAAVLASWLLVVATGVLAALPVIESTAKAVRAGWVPAGDDGIIATRGWDVLSSHTPLVGQYSEAGLVVHGQVMHSPGPMLYWLLALPARYGTVASLAWTMCVFNTIAIVLCVALARRRGGLVLMFAAAIGIALMSQSLPGEAMHDIWNPAAGLFAFLALIFVGWSLACGDAWLLPVGALLASFVVQTHLMYLAPSAVVVSVGVGGLALGWLARRRAVRPRARAADGDEVALGARALHPATAELGAPAGAMARPGGAPTPALSRAEAPTRARRIWPWSLAALVVLAACWTAPVIDQLENNPGNMTMIVRTVEHRGHTLGASVGWNALARSIGSRPWWLYVPASEWERKYDVHKPLSTERTDSAIAVLAALVAVLGAGALRRRWDLFAAALIALGLCAAMVLQVANNPGSRLLSETVGYTLWWGSELGFWVWLVLFWALWLALRSLAMAIVSRVALARERPRGRPGRFPGSLVPGAVAIASLAGLAGLAEVGAAVAAEERPDSHVYEYGPTKSLGADISRMVPPGQTVEYRFGPLGLGTQPMEPAIRFLLVRHGDRVLANGSYRRLGSYYELRGRHPRWDVLVRDGTRRAPGMRLAGRVTFQSPWRLETVSAWVSRASATAGRPARRR